MKSNERRKKPLCDCIETALERYISDLDGDNTNDLYELVICEVEQPLLKIIMRHTKGNQTKAAALLGLNRATLRKKLALYEHHK